MNEQDLGRRIEQLCLEIRHAAILKSATQIACTAAGMPHNRSVDQDVLFDNAFKKAEELYDRIAAGETDAATKG